MYMLKRDLSGIGEGCIKEVYPTKADAIDVFLKQMDLEGSETQESLDEIRKDLEETGKTSIIRQGCSSFEEVVTVRKITKRRSKSSRN